MEPTEDAAGEWTAHVIEGGKDVLLYERDSWMSGAIQM